MDYESDFKRLHVLFFLADELYAVKADLVHEMFELRGISALPRQKDMVRGVINHRGNILPLIDLRRCLGLSDANHQTKDMVRLLTERKQDHLHWLAALERAVAGEGEFTLATDPHQCAFGRWYDTFQTNDGRMSQLLYRFNAPHQRIHALAGEVLALCREGRRDEAQGQIQEARQTTLASLVELFDELIALVPKVQQEIVLLVSHLERTTGFSVDRVEAVEALEIEPLDGLPSGAGDSELICGIGRSEDGRAALILDLAPLVDAA